jgi:hypothetical protein
MRLLNAIKVSRAEDLSIEALPYKYPMRSPMTLEVEIKQIENSIGKAPSYGFKRLVLEPLKAEWLSVVGFGPSLRDTWQQITHPCITMSGSHDFLLERGIVPDYHAQTDGREHQALFITKPEIGVKYLMATICAPQVFEQLRGFDVKLWHNTHGQHVIDWIGKNDLGSILVAGGSNIGLTAIHLGGILGYRKFRIFGMDGNYADGVRHAGKHHDPQPQKVMQREANGKMWSTSPQMWNACDEFVKLKREQPDLQFEIHGDSLLKAMIEDEGKIGSWR